MYSQKIQERFWSKVEKGECCWEWVGNRNNWGYGRIRIKGKFSQAHRVSWEIHNGPIPEGLLCLHKCNNRPCIRPDHLYVGTQKDNMRDMSKAGNHNLSKLTWAIVEEVRQLNTQGVSKSKLAEVCRVSRTQMDNIIHNKQWKT